MVCATRALPFSSARLRRSCIRPSIISRYSRPNFSISAMLRGRENRLPRRPCRAGMRREAPCRLAAPLPAGGQVGGSARARWRGPPPRARANPTVGGLRRSAARSRWPAGRRRLPNRAPRPARNQNRHRIRMLSWSGFGSTAAGRHRIEAEWIARPPRRRFGTAAPFAAGVDTGSRLNGSSKAGELRWLDAARSNAPGNRLLERVRQIGRPRPSRLLFDLGRKEIVAADAHRRPRCRRRAFRDRLAGGRCLGRRRLQIDP